MYYFVSHSRLYFAFVFIAFIFVLHCHERYPKFIMLTVGKVIDCRLRNDSNMMQNRLTELVTKKNQDGGLLCNHKQY